MNQSAIARELQVSRIPVREALRILEREGFVDLEDGGGAVVTPISISDLEEIYELREAIEPYATVLALPNVGRADTMRMEQLARAMESSDDIPAWLEANAQFHRQVYAKSSRPRTIDLIDNLARQTNRYLWPQLAMVHENKTRFDEQHANIVEAVRSRDAEALHDFTVEHLVTAHEGLIHQFLGSGAGIEQNQDQAPPRDKRTDR